MFESISIILSCLGLFITHALIFEISLLVALSGMDVMDAKQLLNDSNGNLRAALIKVNVN